MIEERKYQKGDVVIHRRRPEWGQGVVDQATLIQHDGQPAQRIVARFTHRGRVTLNTAIAPIAIKDSDPSVAERDAAAGGLDGLATDDHFQIQRRLASLLPSMTDPLSSLTARLRATLDSYRYGDTPWDAGQPRDPRRLVDWAIAQTLLSDPLSRFTRHELEQAYPRFARDRDEHFIQLVRQAIKQGCQDQLRALATQVRDAVSQSALKEAMKR